MFIPRFSHFNISLVGDCVENIKSHIFICLRLYLKSVFPFIFILKYMEKSLTLFTSSLAQSLLYDSLCDEYEVYLIRICKGVENCIVNILEYRCCAMYMASRKVFF